MNASTSVMTMGSEKPVEPNGLVGGGGGGTGVVPSALVWRPQENELATSAGRGPVPYPATHTRRLFTATAVPKLSPTCRRVGTPPTNPMLRPVLVVRSPSPPPSRPPPQ